MTLTTGSDDAVNTAFFERLLRHTENFSHLNWLGRPIWQNILDLWIIQETIWEVRPELLVECGTFRGGSAYFYATLFDLMQSGRVITVDIQQPPVLEHRRVTFVTGNSISESVIQTVGDSVAAVRGQIMVILDSDHSATHVARELELYSAFVTPGSFILVQDGIIDVLPMFREGRPGPLAAIRTFLRDHPEFEVDEERTARFLISHHPCGWLRRKR